MNCPICSTVMAWEYDRQRCIISGHSIWHDFKLRAPTKLDKVNGPQPGVRAGYGGTGR